MVSLMALQLEEKKEIEEEGRNREEYIIGCDAGVSFMSSVNCVNEMQVTVISNTTDGAWSVLKDIDTTLKGERVR